MTAAPVPRSPLPTTLAAGERAIVTHDLNKRFGTQTALRAFNLHVPLGAVYLLVGPNGAGKSTALKVLLDLIRTDDGAAEVFGLDSRRDSDRIRANAGYVPELPPWGLPWMRVGRLLAHHACFFPSWDVEYASRLSKAFDVNVDRPVKSLSKGQARRVHLIMALAHRPPLLLLDEPTDGLDPLMRDEALGALAEHLAQTPTTVLLSTHRVNEIEAMVDHIGVMRDGELRAQVALPDLQRNLRRYRARVPDGWKDGFDGAVLRRTLANREVEWTVWGAEDEVVAKLAGVGATVRETQPLSLTDAALALLHDKG